MTASPFPGAQMLTQRRDVGTWWDSGDWWPGHERGPRREQQTPVCIFESVPVPAVWARTTQPCFLGGLLLSSGCVHTTSKLACGREATSSSLQASPARLEGTRSYLPSKCRLFSKERKRQKEIIGVPPGTIPALSHTSRPGLVQLVATTPPWGRPETRETADLRQALHPSKIRHSRDAQSWDPLLMQCGPRGLPGVCWGAVGHLTTGGEGAHS